jgi:hypothetical protein
MLPPTSGNADVIYPTKPSAQPRRARTEYPQFRAFDPEGSFDGDGSAYVPVANPFHFRAGAWSTSGLGGLV